MPRPIPRQWTDLPMRRKLKDGEKLMTRYPITDIRLDRRMVSFLPIISDAEMLARAPTAMLRGVTETNHVDCSSDKETKPEQFLKENSNCYKQIMSKKILNE